MGHAAMKYAAILKGSWQCGPDEWAIGFEVMDCNECTTLKQIHDWCNERGQHALGIELQIRTMDGEKAPEL